MDNRLTVCETLHRFYRDRFYSKATGEEATLEEVYAEFNITPNLYESDWDFTDNEDLFGCYEMETDEDDASNVAVLLPAIQKAIAESKGKFETIELEWGAGGGETWEASRFKLVGYRKENDEEFKKRIDQESKAKRQEVAKRREARRKAAKKEAARLRQKLKRLKKYLRGQNLNANKTK